MLCVQLCTAATRAAFVISNSGARAVKTDDSSLSTERFCTQSFKNRVRLHVYRSCVAVSSFVVTAYVATNSEAATLNVSSKRAYRVSAELVQLSELCMYIWNFSEKDTENSRIVRLSIEPHTEFQLE